MKKICLVLLIAVLALSFMGCPTTYSDEYDYALIVADLVGDFNGALNAPDNAGVKAEMNSDGTYGITFTYKDTMSDWGGGKGTLNFKARSVAGNWDTGICAPASGDKIKLNEDFVECYYRPTNGGADGGNICIEELKDGKEYTITFKVVGDVFSVKITG